jgi:hypothetical protein
VKEGEGQYMTKKDMLKVGDNDYINPFTPKLYPLLRKLEKVDIEQMLSAQKRDRIMKAIYKIILTSHK